MPRQSYHMPEPRADRPRSTPGPQNAFGRLLHRMKHAGRSLGPLEAARPPRLRLLRGGARRD